MYLVHAVVRDSLLMQSFESRPCAVEVSSYRFIMHPTAVSVTRAREFVQGPLQFSPITHTPPHEHFLFKR
jgi:hypothetical protein